MKCVTIMIIALTLAGSVGDVLGEDDSLREPLERKRRVAPTRGRRAPRSAAMLREREHDESAEWKLDERGHSGKQGRSGGRGGDSDRDDGEDD